MYMPIFILIAVQIGGCGYALARGGGPERWGTALYVVNVVCSNLAAYFGQRHLLTADTGLLAVDAGYTLLLAVLAVRAQRFWPIWAASLQLDAVLTHLLMFSKTTPPFSYGFALWLWGLPLPILLAVGAWRHRQRIKRWGDDPAWT